MSIRDTVRRALRKSSASSGSSGTATPTSAVSSNTSQSSSSSSSLHKTTSMLSRAFTWSGRDKSDFAQPQPAKSPKQHKKRGPRVHPSEKPLTTENLKHQELLNQFTMTFGASDPTRLDSMSFYGVSPCCTRRPSIDGDFTSSTMQSSAYDIPSTYDEDMVPP